MVCPEVTCRDSAISIQRARKHSPRTAKRGYRSKASRGLIRLVQPGEIDAHLGQPFTQPGIEQVPANHAHCSRVQLGRQQLLDLEEINSRRPWQGTYHGAWPGGE